MAGLIRTLFRSKKTKKEEESNQDVLFQPCTKRQPTARFADDCMLPATAAYHTESAPKLKKGPQSCPGGYREESDAKLPELLKKKNSGRRRDLFSQTIRQDFMIDVDREPPNHKRYQSRVDLRGQSQFDLRTSDLENDENCQMAAMERKTQFYLQRWEDSERQRKEEKRKQELLEKERNSIQNAMSNMAYCMASVQQMEQLKKERDQYKKEMSRYKAKCEKLESKLETAAMSPNYGGFPPNQHFNFHQPSPYQTPQYPAPMSFTFSNQMPQRHPPATTNFMAAHPNFPSLGPMQPLHRSTNFLNNASLPNVPSLGLTNQSHRVPSSFTMSNASTTSDGAGESLVNPADVSFLRNQFLQVPSQILSGSMKPSSIRDRNNFYEDDEDEVKNFRMENPLPTPSPFSELTQSTGNTV